MSYRPPDVNINLSPFSTLNYLIEDPIRGALLNGDAKLVLIPQPIRYALHKLIVSQEREVTAGAKRQKDLWQAFQLPEFFDGEVFSFRIY
ncbi:MAG: GSU2403 family nucleotidyltransferase fold protein [Deltaproteobacteria bacterium]|nr:GSU2403 family nucleotidyltransferase fold protein [Deltaproteobacteria bacterium]